MPGPLDWVWLQLKSGLRVQFEREWGPPLPELVHLGILTKGMPGLLSGFWGRPRVSIGKEEGVLSYPSPHTHVSPSSEMYVSASSC